MMRWFMLVRLLEPTDPRRFAADSAARQNSPKNAPRLRTFCQVNRMQPSTLMSRFFRAGLPSPKMYLAMTRVVFAARFLESPTVSIADVAYRLGYSSPQSFGRHLRSFMGIGVGELRRQFTFEAAMQHFVNTLINPYIGRLASFRPLGATPICSRANYDTETAAPHVATDV
jgi:AraC-like DNA-binding protein